MLQKNRFMSKKLFSHSDHATPLFCFRLHFRSASYKEIRGKIETTNFDMKNGPFGNNDLYAITLAS